MSKNTVCTHCKKSLECKVDNISECECSNVPVSNDTRLFLSQTYHKCLCSACLSKIEKMIQYAKVNEFPKRRSQMQEGTHYYMENGYFVFTELYHLMKGQCCQNGCRHCVYGFKNRYL
ncbi:cysteine-rich CWC family protein [Myroides indicus]|uniref:Cysteine-rich CWC n=1 Tax=Myroides indicus TaxID=1323422 RepID=A0A4R7EZ12_9FLAO|nr:cysteine-rich CWC family protein [Myroides indicus]TDS60151.1 hypothetical protein C8P70_1097 [Myroides indicus]